MPVGSQNAINSINLGLFEKNIKSCFSTKAFEENENSRKANTYVGWVAVQGEGVADDTADLTSESIDRELFVRVVALQDVANTANRPSILVLTIGTLEVQGLRAARVAVALSKVDCHAQTKSSTTSKEVHERWRLRNVEALDGQD